MMNGSAKNGHAGNGSGLKAISNGTHELKLTNASMQNGFDDKVELELPTLVTSSKKKIPFLRHYAGIFLILMASFLFALMALMIKHLDHFHKFSLGFFRFQGILWPSVAFLIHARVTQGEKIFAPIWPITKNWSTFILLCGRGIGGSITFFCIIFAIKYLTVADALVITACVPVFVALVAHWLLGEKSGIFPIFAALITILGVGIIARPPMLMGTEEFNSETLLGVCVGLGAMSLMIFNIILIRYLNNLHFSVVTLSFGAWGTVLSILASMVTLGEIQVPSTCEEGFILFGISLCSFLHQFLLTLALQREQAGPVALAKTSDCVFAFILQYFFLGVVPDIFRWRKEIMKFFVRFDALYFGNVVGGSIVFLAVTLISLRKWVITLPETHPLAKYCGCITK